MALVSIIIPVYNLEKYLERCIDSISAQTFRDYEILLIDDGSTDNSLSVCKSLAERDQRIRVYHKANGGVSSARNQGIHLAAGDYITFIDGDDVVTPNYLSMFMEDLHEKDYDLMSACMTGRKLPDAEFDFTKPITQHFEALGKLHGACCRLYKISIIRENNIHFDEQILLAEDTVFVYDYLSHCKNMKTHAKILYTYMSTPGSAIHKHYTNVGYYMRRSSDALIHFIRTLSMRSELSDAVVYAFAYANYKYAMVDYAFNEDLRKAERAKCVAETFSDFEPEIKALNRFLKTNRDIVSKLESQKTIAEMTKITKFKNYKKVYAYFNRRKNWDHFSQMMWNKYISKVYQGVADGGRE